MSKDTVAPYPEEMTPPQEAHLKRIKDQFLGILDDKYRKGQHAHGGDLFSKSQRYLLDAAIEEAVDQVVYLLSLRESL